MNTSFDYIDSDAELSAFSARLSAADWMAVDTEFMREKTYYAQLALIQVASDVGNALIDVPALNDLAPLREVFTREDCLKIMHSASQDLEVLGQALGTMPTPLFDTQIAASFLGEPEQIAYANIVRQQLGVELDKDQTRTNWLQRPLSDAQLGYAKDDVLYLRALYEQLLAQLQASERLDWARAESQALAERTLAAMELETAADRLKGLERFSPLQQQIARSLAVWREKRARQRDLPREWVLRKQVLLGIARAHPRSLSQLAEIEGVTDKLVKRLGKALLKAVEQAAEQAPEKPLSVQLNAEQRGLAKRMMAHVRQLGEAHDIAPSLIANRSSIERMILGESKLPLEQGWRDQVAGRTLRKMLLESQIGSPRAGSDDTH